MKSCLNMGPPSSEGTEAICRVPSAHFSQAPWYTLPAHLCRFRVRSIMVVLFPGTSSPPVPIQLGLTTYEIRHTPPGAGILTCFPSTTPFGLVLGADLPCAD